MDPHTWSLCKFGAKLSTHHNYGYPVRHVLTHLKVTDNNTTLTMYTNSDANHNVNQRVQLAKLIQQTSLVCIPLLNRVLPPPNGIYIHTHQESTSYFHTN